MGLALFLKKFFGNKNTALLSNFEAGLEPAQISAITD
jgi:hypothetical protein